MKEVRVTSSRLSATTAEEKRIVESWGKLWSTFSQRDRSGKGIVLIFGDWSGYRSSQYRITHIDWCYHKELPDNFHGTVQFTDGTTMQVWTRRVSRRDILQYKYERKCSYTELISKLIKSGKSFYSVADENREKGKEVVS